MKRIGMESQVGFRWDRGTIDGLFTTYLGLSKRKEHGLETWALLIDLVKAFDLPFYVVMACLIILSRCSFGFTMGQRSK